MYSMHHLVADIWSYVQPYKKDFLSATVRRVIADLVWLYPPYGLAVVVNFFTDYIPGQSLIPVWTVFFLMLAATCIRQIGMYTAKKKMFHLSEKIALDSQEYALKHLMLLDIEWHEKESAGSKMKRIDRGSASMDRILRIWINNLIEITINLVGVILIILKFDLKIGIAVSIFLITYYLIAHFYRKRGAAASNVVNLKQEYRTGILFESMNNIRSVKVMSMAGKIMRTIADSTADTFDAIKKRIYWFQFGNSLRNYYAQLFRLAIMVVIVIGVIHGRYEVGFLVLFYGYFNSVWQAMSELADVSEDFVVAKNAVERMQAILKTPIAIDDEKGKVKFPDDWQKLTLSDVSFSYSDKPVLDNVSLEINRGEKIGIVGLSGAGKSTLLKLLLKEYESYDGMIAFDGVPLASISKKHYFNHLAVVLQDTELFNMTLRENITITNLAEEKNEALLEHAINIAHVRDFMSKLPEGVDSIVGEKGIKLSGGEKQRVGIARAIFRKPQILLLDEATSHLDLESEEKIQDSLHQFFEHVTAIVIAHRLTTIKEMDRIIVIENGKIVESGSFDQLYKNKGRFFDLWEKQKL